MRFEIRRTLRNMRFIIMLLAFPVLLYLIYAKQRGTEQGLTVGVLLMVSMAVYSGMGSAMFASGPQLARERQNGWMRQLRVSPISARGWFAAKLVQGVLLIIPGLALLMLIAESYGHVHLGASKFGALAVILAVGAIPFCVLGLVIGLLFDGQTAQVAQMITLLLLAFLGGIFISWNNLPHVMQAIGKALPSYHLAQMGWDAAAGRGLDLTHPIVLAIWTAALGAVVVWRWRQESAAA
ncbi:MAG: ABC transporter permease [Micromonosporaceae bacterium]